MRKPPVNTPKWRQANPHRFCVMRSLDPVDVHPWEVWTGYAHLDGFPTHAEAIAYADSLARSRPGDEQSPHPPHTRPLTAPGNA